MSKLSIVPFTIFFAILSLLLGIGLIACYWNRGWLSIESASNLASIFESAAVGISLLFIAVQANQQTKQVNQQTMLAKASNSQSFVATSSDFVLTVSGSNELMDLYSTGGAKYETLTPEKQAQYRYLVGWWLTFYENVHYQNDCKLLDDSVYKAWMKDMDGFIRRRSVEKVWDSLKGNYSEGFTTYLRPLIEKRQKELTSPPAS